MYSCGCDVIGTYLLNRDMSVIYKYVYVTGNIDSQALSIIYLDNNDNASQNWALT